MSLETEQPKEPRCKACNDTGICCGCGGMGCIPSWDHSAICPECEGYQFCDCFAGQMAHEEHEAAYL